MKMSRWINGLALTAYMATTFGLAGCAIPAVMTDDDWAKLDSKLTGAGWSEEDKGEFMAELDERTMSPEEYEVWKQDMAGEVGDVVTALIPGPADEPLGDIASLITAAILGGGSIFGGGWAVKRSLQNSEEGKLLGPIVKLKSTAKKGKTA